MLALSVAFVTCANSFLPGQTPLRDKTLVDDIDSLDSEVIKKYHDGKIMTRANYLSGKLHGEWKYYDNRGRLHLSNHFAHGVMDRYCSFWRSGVQGVLAHFDHGYMDGEMKTFYKDGSPESTIIFPDGKILSALRLFDKKGQLKQIKFPSAENREYLISVDLYKKGMKVKTQTINERPPSFYLFALSVHKPGPLEDPLD